MNIMTPKELFLKQVEERKAKHPHTVGPKLIFFVLAMCFFGLSIILIGICHSPIEGWAGSVARLILTLFMIIILQCSVAFSAIGVTSSRYVLHGISCASLALSLGLDIGLIVYYTVFVV